MNFTPFDLLRAGHSTRYHVENWPGQSVAEHSWFVTMLVLMLYENPSAELITCALTHDAAEFAVVDLPAPLKWKYGNLARMVESIEDEVRVKLGLPSPNRTLSTHELEFLTACDVLEALLYLYHLAISGNNWALTGIDEALSYLMSRMHQWPKMEAFVSELIDFSGQQEGFLENPNKD